jgi:hypothetical protein
MTRAHPSSTSMTAGGADAPRAAGQSCSSFVRFPPSLGARGCARPARRARTSSRAPRRARRTEAAAGRVHVADRRRAPPQVVSILPAGTEPTGEGDEPGDPFLSSWSSSSASVLTAWRRGNAGRRSTSFSRSSPATIRTGPTASSGPSARNVPSRSASSVMSKSGSGPPRDRSRQARRRGVASLCRESHAR